MKNFGVTTLEGFSYSNNLFLRKPLLQGTRKKASKTFRAIKKMIGRVIRTLKGNNVLISDDEIYLRGFSTPSFAKKGKFISREV